MRTGEETDLLMQVRAGDIQAFEKLFHQYSSRSVDLASAFVGNSGLAEEVVSDVFFSLWQRREDLPPIDHFPSYLYTAIRFRAMRSYRQGQKLKIIPLEEYDEKVGELSAGQPDRLEAKELDNALGQLIGKLPPQRRLIFTLKRVDGLSYSQIAGLLHISERTVEKQMALAMKFFRQYMEQYAALFLSLLAPFLLPLFLPVIS